MRYVWIMVMVGALTTISPALATIRIAGDAGGQIGAYAPDPYRRREALRRLRRRHHAGVRSGHRGGAHTKITCPLAVLGASNYTYAEACLSERWLPDWIGAPRQRGLSSSAGCRRRSSATTSKQGLRPPAAMSRESTGPIRISPPITARRSCQRGPASRRDKAKVEGAVLIVERWIPCAAARPAVSSSLAELQRCHPHAAR